VQIARENGGATLRLPDGLITLTDLAADLARDDFLFG